jgi:hypothetical protein
VTGKAALKATGNLLNEWTKLLEEVRCVRRMPPVARDARLAANDGRRVDGSRAPRGSRTT